MWLIQQSLRRLLTTKRMQSQVDHQLFENQLSVNFGNNLQMGPPGQNKNDVNLTCAIMNLLLWVIIASGEG